MKIAKLKEALEELKQEREAISGVIIALERAIEIAKRGDTLDLSTIPENVVSSDASQARRISANAQMLARQSYVKLAQMVLRLHGKPMNIKELVYEVSKVKGHDVSRNSLEGTLFRHIKSAKEAAVVLKVGPAFYALPEWPREIRSLWSEKVASA
jgi:HB1/ASXL restriction endonuclease-like protein with HTH domain